MTNQIQYLDKTFDAENITTGNVYYARSLISDTLEIDTFDFDIRNNDETLTEFERNTPITYYHNGNQMGIFYLQKVSRKSINTYRFECTSTIGLLDESYHNGGIYTGQTVKEIAENICNPYPVIVKTNIQNIKIYGWLPITTKRENLSQLAFAIGATVKIDYNGVLRIEGLWDGIAAEITEDYLYSGGSIKYDTKITQVIVTEHGYGKTATETTELFNGTAAQGDKITFSDPCYDLVADGFSIIESGANYAIVSAGSGTLTGKKYTHTTRTVQKSVSPERIVSQSDNIIKVENATLLSLTNANAVAERLVSYYTNTERIVNGVVLQRESPGDVVKIYHPYKKQLVSGCIESSDVTVSGKLKSNETILVGYSPTNIGESEYYDTVELITESKQWQVPENVTSIRAILIGGGQGGYSGLDGEDGTNSGKNDSETYEVTDYTQYTEKMGYGKYGNGGKAGLGGSGGKIFQTEISVNPGDVFQITIGKGGIGGTHSSGSSVSGSFGESTTFGSYSSENGASSDSGFIDPITGETYGGKGNDGIDGGHGSGSSSDTQNPDEYEEGNIIIDIDGTQYNPGKTNVNYISDESIYGSTEGTGPWGYVRAVAVPGCAGGAAIGNNGIDGIDDATAETSSSGGLTANAIGGTGANGANAKAPTKNTKRGFGGNGGNGGGGAGGGGFSQTERRVPTKKPSPSYEISTETGEGGKGGTGSNGGEAGDGCVIIYLRVYKPKTFGRVITRDGKVLKDKYKRTVIR